MTGLIGELFRICGIGDKATIADSRACVRSKSEIV